jgi:glycosyltransferase involved in cell wall biosynthesis
MKRVACVVDTISKNAGGLNASVRGLMAAIKRRGHTICIFSVSDPHTEEARTEWLDAHPEWESKDIRVVRSRGLRQFGYAPDLGAALDEFDADLVHCHGLWTYTSVATESWRRRTGKPVVIHPHGMLDKWALRNSFWKKWAALALYERRNLTSASCIRALCQAEMESVRDFRLYNPVCVVPNGIDLPQLNPGEPNARRSGKKILLYLGRLHPKKGLSHLITAWSQLLHRGGEIMDWTLAIAGWDQDGHEEDLKRQATSLGVSWSDVRTHPAENGSLDDFLTQSSPLMFLGPQFGVQKEQLYGACEAFVLPSFSEGLPMVVLEAWAYAKPVVMTPMCNIPEGFAANAALKIDPTAAGIEEGLGGLMLLSDEERKAMGQRGRRLAEDQFSWDQVGARMIEVNEWLVRGGEKPSCVFL